MLTSRSPRRTKGPVCSTRHDGAYHGPLSYLWRYLTLALSMMEKTYINLNVYLLLQPIFPFSTMPNPSHNQIGGVSSSFVTHRASDNVVEPRAANPQVLLELNQGLKRRIADLEHDKAAASGEKKKTPAYVIYLS